jgi:hypothetical protein
VPSIYIALPFYGFDCGVYPTNVRSTVVSSQDAQPDRLTAPLLVGRLEISAKQNGADATAALTRLTSGLRILSLKSIAHRKVPTRVITRTTGGSLLTSLSSNV